MAAEEIDLVAVVENAVSATEAEEALIAVRCPRILFAEDESLVQLVIVEELNDAGFDVAPVSNADDALDLFTRDPTFDLLLTDIRMPGRMNGWDVAEALRRIRSDLPVIYATGYSPTDLRPVPGGIVLGKPYAIGMLLTAIDELGIRFTPAAAPCVPDLASKS